jgi:hypothetical protein
LAAVSLALIILAACHPDEPHFQPSHISACLCLRSAICLDLMDKADVLEYYEQSVRSVQLE